jgi:restriction endonuclease S subunit
MKVRLKDIAAIQPGVHIRPSEYMDNQTGNYLGFRDFDDNLNFIGCLTKVDPGTVKTKYIMKDGDILFSTRIKFNAYNLPSFGKEKFIASNAFVIIKPDNRKVNSDFLSWTLNHFKTQQDFQKMMLGAILPYISVKKLEELKINLPSKETQQKIIDFYKIQQKEQSLLLKIAQKKEIYYQTLLFELMNNEQ